MELHRKPSVLVMLAGLIAMSTGPTLVGHSAQASPIQQPDEGWLMDSDGSNQHKVLDMTTALSRPAWSPDGSEVAFSGSGAGFVIVAADGSHQRTLLDSGVSGLDWSPDGTTIAFSYHSGSNRDIYLIQPDGSNMRRLSNTSGLGVRPNWSPDGTMVAFLDVDHEDGTRGHALYLIDADGTGQRQIADGIVDPVNMNALTWSPDSTRIAAATHDGDIAVVATDGSGTTNITTTEAIEVSPDWSPDGSRIAFEREGEIYSAAPDGSAITELHDNPEGTDSDPRWSPDGTRIAFVMSGDIHAIAVDGSSQTNLTSTDFRTEHLPAWSPDSAKIAYSAYASSGPAGCDDGIDNDDDGLIDFPNDPGCSSAADDNEVDHPEQQFGGATDQVVTDGACAGFLTGSVQRNPNGDGVVIVGTDGDDALQGSERDDLVCALAGNDAVSGGAGSDVVWGGEGKDVMVAGAGDDDVFGGGGNDNMNGGDGADDIRGQGGWDTAKGNAGGDVLIGARGNDILQGGGGSDSVRGGAGDDVLKGYRGHDVLRGGDHDDVIRGFAGRDRLFGDAGDDVLNGGAGSDTCRGGRGRDVLRRC